MRGLDVRAIGRQIRDMDGEGFILLEFIPDTDARGMQATVNAAIDRANEVAQAAGQDNGIAGFRCSDTLPSPQGYFFSTERASIPAAVPVWMNAFEQALGEDGITGRLRQIRNQSRPGYADSRLATIAVVSLSGWKLKREEGREDVQAAWESDPNAADMVRSWARDWTSQGRSVGLYLIRDGSVLIPASFATLAMNPLTHCALTWWPDPDHYRWVSFCSSGRIVIACRDTTGGWATELDAITTALRELAPVSEHAIVRRAYTVSHDSNVFYSMPGPHPNIQHQRALAHYVGYAAPDQDADHILDAAPVMLLTDTHLARAAVPPRWTDTDLGNGRHLFTIDDPAPWLTDPGPDPDTLAAARADLAPLLWQPPASAP